MEFLTGLLLGIGLGLAVRGVWLESARVFGVEKPKDLPPAAPQEWAQTKNFLYYDGTVMPKIKEDANEQ